ncbi:MAG: ABC transporter ATP-binding protein [Anaerolineales bacterium]|nr:ABC transporter ATP-binding protein [Anaerolineales bacterium]
MSDNYFEEEEFTTKFSGKTFRRIVRQALPHWPSLLGFLAAIAVVSSLDSYFTYLSKRIIDEGIISKIPGVINQIILQYGLLILVQSIAVFGFIYMAGILGERIAYDLRRKLFNHLQDLSLSYYNVTPVGWIISRVTSDTTRIADLTTWGLLDVTWATMNILTAVYFMVIINWKMALIVFFTLPILIYISVKFKERILTEFRQVRKLNSRITGAYNENITGVRVVKALRREERNLEQFQDLSLAMYQSSYKAKWLSALFLPVVQLISSIALGAIIAYSGIQITAGKLSVGGIYAFLSYVTFMMWPIQDLARVYAEMQQSIASAERAFSLLDTQPDITNRPNAREINGLRGDIIFDHVSFHYEADKPVLQDISLHIKQGEMIALVGPTGGGKTTIVNLLARFFEPLQGTISFNGIDYTSLTLQSIQSHIGMVLQTPHLFSGSIQENIRYGKLDATDKEVRAAAKTAGADTFIKKMAKGYSDDVGEGGNLLSVGQKQLISIARAVLSNPDIFIMDEATSSVDTLTEALIQQGMNALLKDRTSFIIAHRLSTIKRADRILVIDDGKIIESGTHQELLRKGDFYFRLYTSQFRIEKEQQYTGTSLPQTI